MKTSLLNIFGTSKEKESINFNRKAFTFFICLLIAVFFWTLSALSKEYSAQVSFTVKYINLPTNKVVANELPSTLVANIKASGFVLLDLEWKEEMPIINIDVAEARANRGKNVFSLSTIAVSEKMNLQFPQGIKITRIFPDSIIFNYNKKALRLVPVRLHLDLGFVSQHQLSDSALAIPAEIEISGEQSVINKINFVDTKLIALKNLSKSVEVKAEIDLTNLAHIDLQMKTVQVKIPVAEFTEGTLDLPIEAINTPEGYQIKTFPDKVTVRYQVNLGDYEKINASEFKVVVDYSKAREGSTNRLKVDLVKAPAEVKFVKLIPEKVEFIIRK